MLPPFTDSGDLPPGIHSADWSEIEQRFGTGSLARAEAYAKLRHLHRLAERTEGLVRFLVFGSFVSAHATPRDVDIVLVMATNFHLEESPRESFTLFSHADAQARFGATVFWYVKACWRKPRCRSFSRHGKLSGTEVGADYWRSHRDTQRTGVNGNA
jgi:predicted nucleotidyltransferase